MRRKLSELRDGRVFRFDPREPVEWIKTRNGAIGAKSRAPIEIHPDCYVYPTHRVINYNPTPTLKEIPND